jgi:hypothetical protein
MEDEEMNSFGQVVAEKIATEAVSTMTDAAAKRKVAGVLSSKLDTNACREICEKRLVQLVQDNPLCGTDSTAHHGQIVFSKPLELLFRDVLQSSGGMLVFQAEHGSGKSYTVNSLVRAHLPDSMQPDRFLVVTPGDHDGIEDWFAGLFSTLGVVGLSRVDLVELLVKVLSNKDIETDKVALGLNVDVKELKVALATCPIAKKKNGSALLVIEDFSPVAFESTKEVAMWNHAQHLKDATALGQPFKFLGHLARAFHTAGMTVILTTRFERVARALHYIVNGGSKCKIAQSLLDPAFEGCDHRTFDYAQHYRGLRWNEPSKIHFFSNKFPQVNHQLISKHAASDASIRQCCEALELAPITIKTSSSAPSLMESSGSGNASECSNEEEEEEAVDSYCQAFEDMCVVS